MAINVSSMAVETEILSKGERSDEAKKIQKDFVKAVEHACVDLEIHSNRELARRIGVTDTTWCEIRKGKKSPSLETIAGALEVVGLQIKFESKPDSDGIEMIKSTFQLIANLTDEKTVHDVCGGILGEMEKMKL